MKKFRNRTIIILIIKILILIVSYSFIYNQVFFHKSFTEVSEEVISKLATGNYWFLIWVLLLMILNRGLEAVKWRMLIQKIETISFFNAFQAIFSGIVISLFTPNRVGEFGGRILYLKRRHLGQGVVVTIVGNISQLITTLIIGTFCLLIYSRNAFEINVYIYYSVVLLVFCAFLVLLTGYYNMEILKLLLNKIPFVKRFSQYTEVFSYYSSTVLTKVLMLSIGRFIVFTLQYLLLLYLFKIEIGVAQGVMLISVIFLIQTILPHIALLELGIRGSIALYFLGMYSQDNTAIISSTFTLWLINIILPAIIGTLCIINLRFDR